MVFLVGSDLDTHLILRSGRHAWRAEEPAAISRPGYSRDLLVNFPRR